MNTLIFVFALFSAAFAVPQFAPYNKLNLKFAGPGAPPAPISAAPVRNYQQPPSRTISTAGETLDHGDHIHTIKTIEEIKFKPTGGSGSNRGGGAGNNRGGAGKNRGGAGNNRGGIGGGGIGGGGIGGGGIGGAGNNQGGIGGGGIVGAGNNRGANANIGITSAVRGTASGTGLGSNLNPGFRIAEQPNNGQYIAILKQEHGLDYDGTYRYNFDSENGISLEEHGGLQNIGQENEAMAAQGFYSYTGPDGVLYTVTYIADENGFQPQGVHIPR